MQGSQASLLRSYAGQAGIRLKGDRPKGGKRVVVIPGLTRARSEAIALSRIIFGKYAPGCRIKSGMT